MESKRKYRVVTFIGEMASVDAIVYTLDEILQDTGSEINYSLQEVIDDILDLKPFEKMFFYSNRDDKNSNSIIIRLV